MTQLQQHGLPLLHREAGNFLLPTFPELIVKDSYRRWPERDLAGNAIDFCVQVLGLCEAFQIEFTGRDHHCERQQLKLILAEAAE